MVFSWKPNSRIKTSAAMAGEMCEHLEKTVGLTAETLLAANVPEDAPLHNEFEWDNEKAAHEYRLVQSRHIINSLVITVEDKPASEPVRAFFKIEPKTSNYESFTVIVQSEDKQKALLNQALNELKAFAKKYNQLAELMPVMQAIDEVTKWTA